MSSTSKMKNSQTKKCESCGRKLFGNEITLCDECFRNEYVETWPEITPPDHFRDDDEEDED